MLGNGRPSGTGIGEKGDTDRGLLPLTDQQFRHRRKLHNGFKVLAMLPRLRSLLLEKVIGDPYGSGCLSGVASRKA